MEWSEEIIAQLKDLWAEGLSTAEIGRRLSITKNAVVGKAHRLGLPPRPSPIRRNGSKPKVAADKAEQLTPTPLATETPASRAAAPSPSPVVHAAQPIATTAPAPVVEQSPAPATAAEPGGVDDKAARKEKAAPVARTSVKPKTLLRSISDPEPQKRRGPSCCWPIGDPGTPGFHFCGATPIPGKPYCEEHAQIAYVRLRDRRDSVA
ncbi:GcrA family cell cycle regulator [Acetobacter fabarum]|uniref:GcrA family cell cycle regulator n=1 Tax=Acetobacter fabarum TaxID=483199 RepID=UPI00312BA686